MTGRRVSPDLAGGGADHLDAGDRRGRIQAGQNQVKVLDAVRSRRPGSRSDEIATVLAVRDGLDPLGPTGAASTSRLSRLNG